MSDSCSHGLEEETLKELGARINLTRAEWEQTAWSWVVDQLPALG